MRRAIPHSVAAVGALLLVWMASLVREAGARLAAIQFSISWGHYGTAMLLWFLAGLLLALPAITPALAAGKRLKLHAPTLAIYLVPGLFFMLTLPLYLLAGSLNIFWLPTAWLPTRYGVDFMGSLLVGYGLAQSLTAGASESPTASRPPMAQ